MIGKAICTVIMAGGIGYMLGAGFDSIKHESDVNICARHQHIPVIVDGTVFCKKGDVYYLPEDLE